MRLGILFLFSILLFGCQTSQPTKSQASSGIGVLGLIFGVTQDESDDVTSIRFTSAQDVATKSAADFNLPPHLLAQATTELTEYWSGRKTDYESGTEFFVICVYTNLDPDNVGCSRGE